MIWVIACTLIAYIIVNLPLLYSLVAVHGPSGIGKLWGYAPNQFFFLVVLFPFAAFATFTCLNILVTRLAPRLPENYPLKFFFYENWAAAMMIAVVVGAVIALIAYFSSAATLDKLQPAFATRAVAAMQSLSTQPATSTQNVTQLQSEGQSTERWLASLSKRDYLSVVTDRSQQLRLGIVDPTTQSLNMLQLLVGMTVGVMAVIGVLLSAHAMQQFGGSQDYPELKMAVNASFWAVLFFSAYPICYRVWRIALERATGQASTIMQDILVFLVIIVAMGVLRFSDPANRQPTLQAILGYAPMLFVAGGYGGELLSPGLVNRLIGFESNTGIQLIVALILVIFSGVAAAGIWPTSS
jgi:hypothetical protein